MLLAGLRFHYVYCNIKIPQVPGLHKSSNTKSHMVTKLKPLIRAKVSGLSRKLSPVQKRKDCDTENKLGLQSTIGEFWKSFQFKRWVALTPYLVHCMLFSQSKNFQSKLYTCSPYNSIRITVQDWIFSTYDL